MECSKCRSGMARVEHGSLSRYECWMCSTVVYDPLPESVSVFEAEDSMPVCYLCLTEFEPTERNQIYCYKCKKLRVKPASSFHKLYHIMVDEVSDLSSVMDQKELDILISQVQAYCAELAQDHE